MIWTRLGFKGARVCNRIRGGILADLVSHDYPLYLANEVSRIASHLLAVENVKQPQLLDDGVSEMAKRNMYELSSKSFGDLSKGETGSRGAQQSDVFGLGM